MSQSQSPQLFQPSTLEYGQRSRLGWVGRHRKKLIFLALCIAVAILVYQYRASLIHRVLWLYWSHQAATFRMPGHIELIVSDPTKARTLIATDQDYVASWEIPGAAVYSPLVYRQLREVDPRVMLNVIAKEEIVFIGSRQRPDGALRLVIVKGAKTYGMITAAPEAIVLPMPGLRDPLPTARLNQLAQEQRWSEGTGPVELRGAVADPADPTHLIFRFVIGPNVPRIPEHVRPDQIGAQGMADAYLQNNDSLKFSIRNTAEIAPYEIRALDLEGSIATRQGLVPVLTGSSLGSTTQPR